MSLKVSGNKLENRKELSGNEMDMASICHCAYKVVVSLILESPFLVLAAVSPSFGIK